MTNRGRGGEEMATLFTFLVPFDPSLGSDRITFLNTLFGGSPVWFLCQQFPALPGNLLEIEIFGPHPRLTERESLGEYDGQQPVF